MNLDEYLVSQNTPNALVETIKCFAGLIIKTSKLIEKAPLNNKLGKLERDTNIQGEDQQKLDVYANEKFIQTLVNRNIVCGIASEEEDDFISINSSDNKHQNKYVVLMDPLDGSSNIDVNVSVGTIFSIYRRVTPVGTPVKLQDFLQKGNEQVAAGYIIYGTSTMLVYTTGGRYI